MSLYDKSILATTDSNYSYRYLDSWPLSIYWIRVPSNGGISRRFRFDGMKSLLPSANISVLLHVNIIIFCIYMYIYTLERLCISGKLQRRFIDENEENESSKNPFAFVSSEM